MVAFLAVSSIALIATYAAAANCCQVELFFKMKLFNQFLQLFKVDLCPFVHLFHHFLLYIFASLHYSLSSNKLSCASHILRKAPFFFSNSSFVPHSSTLPLFITMILSASTAVLNLCVTITPVFPVRICYNRF